MKSMILIAALLLLGIGDVSCVATAQAPQPVQIWQSDGNVAGALYGRGLNRLGDLDGDGHDDLAVYMFAASVPEEIRVLSGATGAVIHSYLAVSPNPAFVGHFENRVARITDQDGDGVEDFTIIYEEEDPAAGITSFVEVRVLSGATGAMIRALTTPMGPYVGVADYDGDGFGDLLASAAGQVYSSVGVYSSVTGQLIFQTTGSVPFGAFGGWDVEVLGDVNGDGWDDYVTTEGNSAYSGSPTYVYMISGIDGSILYSLVGTPTFLYGRYVANAGDLNGDGIPDFAVQAGNPLQVDVHSGVDGSLIHSIGRPGPLFVNGVLCTAFARTLDGGEDLDGDAVPDLVIGDPLAPNTAGDAAAGRIYVYSGGTQTLTFVDEGGFSGTFIGCGPAQGLGTTLALLGDVDGDGIGDFAAGAPHQPTSPTDWGFVRAYAGQPWTSDGARAGNVNANGVGGVVDVLRVDVGMTGQPSAGQGTSRSLDLTVGLPFSLWMAAPPAGPGIAPYVLWGQVSEALVFQAVTLPFGVGDMAITPPFLAPGDPTLFTLSDTFSYANQLLPAFPAVGQGNGIAVSSVTTGIPFPATFTLQGVILDASSPVGVSVTNALRLHVD